MRTLSILAATLLFTGFAQAAEHASWDKYMKANRFACPGPLDTLDKPQSVTLAGKKYTHTGFQLKVQNPDSDSKVKIGVVSAIKDVSEPTLKNVAESLEWFKKEKVEWIVANGDLALEEFDLEDLINLLVEPGIPVLVVIGNTESLGSWARVYKNARREHPHLINGTWVRQIIADDVEFWTMPGYHDKRFVHQNSGCLYKTEDAELLRRKLEPDGKAPVVMVAHGPPQCSGKHGIDRISDGANVGDPALNKLMKHHEIRFGIFGHILEAGGTAVAGDMKSAVAPGKVVDSLHVNAGALSGDPWPLNNGKTAYGMALLVTLDKGKASFQIKRYPPRFDD